MMTTDAITATPVPYDYGFSFADDAINAEITRAAKASSIPQEKLDAVLALVVPLLKSLEQNPDKVYLKWENRAAIVGDVLAKLNEISGK